MPVWAAADYHEDSGDVITAAWLRDEGIYPPDSGSIVPVPYLSDLVGYMRGQKGSGTGCGMSCSISMTAFGHGVGSGYGYGNGSGEGAGLEESVGGLAGTLDWYPIKDRGEKIHRAEIILPAIGQYVIVFSRDAGVFCGEYQRHSGREVVLREARPIDTWRSSRFEFNDFAKIYRRCHLSPRLYGEMTILDACGIIEVTPKMEAFLREREHVHGY
jgi:hypothetical protein